MSDACQAQLRELLRLKNFQIITDKAAIGLSLLCAFHCLALPFILVLFPSMIALQLKNESFHLWMILAVIPTSAYALTLGCNQHKKHKLLILGLIGLGFLISAVIFGERFLGEALEKVLTVIGAGIVMYAHFTNYRLCRDKENCECHKLSTEP